MRDTAAAKARAIRVAAALKKLQQTSTHENDTIAKREHMNKLIADMKSLEEGNKRLAGGALDKGLAGDRVKAFRGRGERRYVSALRIKGKRVLVLLDTSASMMEDDVVKVHSAAQPARVGAQACAQVATRHRHGGVGQRASCRPTASFRCTAST